MAAVVLNSEGNPQHGRGFNQIGDLKGTTLANWARKALQEGIHLVTNGFASIATAGSIVAERGANMVSPH